MSSEEATHVARDLLKDAGVPYLVDVRFGDPARVIGRVAMETGCSHVVMGTRGLTALDAVVLGSVAYTTLHTSSLPVTLIK